MYTTLKFIHVMAAIVWIGSGVALLSVTAALLRARDYDGAAALGRQSQKLGTRLFAPAAVVTLIAGVAMVIVGGLSFARAWIIIGLGGVALSFVFGVVLGERAEATLREALADRGASDGPVATDGAGTDVAVAEARRRLMLTSGIDLVVLTFVVWAMVAKPGL